MEMVVLVLFITAYFTSIIVGTLAETYTNACVPIPLPCSVGQRFANPCSCQSYLECSVTTNDMLVRDCANGLKFDHQSPLKICVSESIVLGRDDGCTNDTAPWKRCVDLPGSYPESSLSQFCSGGGNNNGTNGGNNGGGNNDDNEGSDDNTAAIVAGVVCGIVLLVIIVVIAVFVWRRFYKNSSHEKSGSYRINTTYQGQVQSRHAEEDDEDVYDVIDEKAVKPDLPRPQSGAASNVYLNLGYTSGPDDYSLAQHVPDDNGPHTLTVQEQRDDLSRTVSVNGKEIEITDFEGYEVGYPSGTMPRLQLHSSAFDGQAPQNDYFVLENDSKTETT